MIPQDSARFWLSKLLTDPWLSGLVPSTRVIDYDEEALYPSLHGQPSKEYERLYYAVEEKIRFEVGYPAFIRTDITSAKHAGKEAWYIPNEDAVNTALLKTLYASFIKSYRSKVKASAILVRPFLNLKHERTAFNGLPIAKEWRVFAECSRQPWVQCIHHYWPDEALDGFMDDGKPPNSSSPSWTKDWVSSEAIDAAVRAVTLMGAGKWSIDFAEAEDGKLWLLDMATAGNSYHAPGCKYAGLDIENKL